MFFFYWGDNYNMFVVMIFVVMIKYHKRVMFNFELFGRIKGGLYTTDQREFPSL